jgi:6-pyruvoyltetrahydropterin/6-carboxytetrahydropterin synthase
MEEDKIKCEICGEITQQITYAHLKTHGFTMKDYFEKFPDTKLRSKNLEKRMIENQIKSQYQNEHNQCRKCGKDIKWNQMFCSTECANSRRIILKVEDICLKCNKVFYKPATSSQKFCCEECYREYKHDNKKENLSEYILKKYNYSCILCGSTENIRVHHIDGNRENNTEENLGVVCESCHRKIHNGFIATVYKTFTIEAAHHLPDHPTCGFLHGHSATITVGVKGSINLKTGMVIDFKILKKIIEEVIVSKFDHAYLNEYLPIPTAEILAYYIFLKLKEAGLNVEVVRYYETKDNYAEVKL